MSYTDKEVEGESQYLQTHRSQLVLTIESRKQRGEEELYEEDCEEGEWGAVSENKTDNNTFKNI